jgi:hypothetical protein
MKLIRCLVVVFVSFIAFFMASCYQPTQYVPPVINLGFAPKDTITAFTGSANFKMAFTKKIDGIRCVHFIDYSQSPLLPVMLKKPVGKDAIDADSPILSPDGKYVTYYLVSGNIEQGAYVQYLDENSDPVEVDSAGTEPHWWQDSSGQFFIVYSNKFQSDHLVAGIGKTFHRPVTFSSNTPVAGDAVEIAPYPMNGGLSHNGRYLCTGYYDAAFYDLAAQIPIPVNSGLQTCNPSICPDAAINDRMMFLNIGGVQNLLGTFASDPSYPADANGSVRSHQVIFVVDKTNNVISFIPGISPYVEWQDPEWTNNTGFSVALGLINPSTADARLINLSTKETLNLTPGDYKFDNTSTPYFWFGN